KKAFVTGVCSSRNIEFMRVIKADQVIDYKTTRIEDVVKDADLVFDAAGGDTKPAGWKVLKPGGTFVSITGKPDTNDPSSTGKNAVGFIVTPSKEQLTQIAALIDEGYVKPVVSTVLPLSDAVKAQNMLQQARNIRGKIVLKVV
ncbi:MAG TPA: zinc-binding dehydrogenase, partial [Bacteroidales bacterium]